MSPTLFLYLFFFAPCIGTLSCLDNIQNSPIKIYYHFKQINTVPVCIYIYTNTHKKLYMYLFDFILSVHGISSQIQICRQTFSNEYIPTLSLISQLFTINIYFNYTYIYVCSAGSL